MLIDRRLISQFDFVLLGLTFIIPVFGLIVLFSAGYDAEWSGVPLLWSSTVIRSQAFLKQFIFLGAGLVVLMLGVSISPNLLSRYAYALYGVCIVMLILVDVMGTIVNGSQRWLSLGSINVQPAEPTKLALILALGRYISRNPPRPGGYTFKELIIPALFFLIPTALILKQPDLGTAMVVSAVGGLMLLFAGIRPKVLLIAILSVLVATVPAWHALHDYQKKRVLVLIDPDIDPKGSGYHINQSKIAVGSGSLFGKGFMQGTQTQLEFLPEHTTDFIFSVLAEEWGFAGCIVVLSFYLAFLLRILHVVSRSKELHSGMVITGIGALIFVHSVVNVGMVMGILPVVGLPLPLFSYGGSSVLSCMFSMGIVLGLDMRRLFHVTRA